MTGMEVLRPGDIGFGPLYGGWGSLAMWGEVICDGGFRVGDLNVGHVFVVTEAERPYVDESDQGYSARVVEAMPNGAREWTAEGRWTNRYAYVRLPEDYPGQALDAAAIARAMIGTPYSFASYAALAAWRFGWKTPRLENWINRRHFSEPKDWPYGPWDRLRSGRPWSQQLPAEAICSVLADQAWALTGKQVMPAGTPHQCVTPSALGAALLAMSGAAWFWPGH